MQRTADFHDQIADARLPKAGRLSWTMRQRLDTAVDVFDAHAATRDAPIGSFWGRVRARPRGFRSA